MKKRTITVEVLDYPLLNGSEFTASNYPHDGIFQLPDGRLIARNNVYAMQMCFPVGFDPFYSEVTDQTWSSDETVNTEPVVVAGVDSMTFLKALAISKNPDLALDLCK